MKQNTKYSLSLKKGCTCAVQIYTRYCRHPLSPPSDNYMKVPKFHWSEANVSKRQNLKNRSQHRLICQHLIADNLWNDGAKVMKSFKTCKKSRYFL